MNIIVGGRRTGKTLELIKMSAETGAVIFVLTYQRAECIENMAKKLGYDIPKPEVIRISSQKDVCCSKCIWFSDSCVRPGLVECVIGYKTLDCEPYCKLFIPKNKSLKGVTNEEVIYDLPDFQIGEVQR